MTELRKAIDEEDSKEFTPARNAALSKALAQVMEVQVPDTLITNQAREKFAVMMAEMRDGGVADEEIKKQINPENFLKYKDIVKDDIIRDFKVSMATDEIARLEGITVPDYQVEEQMQSIRKDADASEELDENMIRMKVETTLQRQAVMDWLAERAVLQVEYGQEGEPEFDEALMHKLAEESLEREKKILEEAGASMGEVSESVVTAETVVEEPKPEPVVQKKTKPEPVAKEVKKFEPVAKEVKKSEPVAKEFKKPEPVAKEAKKPEPAAEFVAKEVKKPEPAAEPVVEKKEEKPAERDWDSMTLEERAFAALLDSGAITINKSPDDPDYDSSQDDQEAPDNVYVKK
jgi:hypothetical protein